MGKFHLKHGRVLSEICPCYFLNITSFDYAYIYFTLLLVYY